RGDQPLPRAGRSAFGLGLLLEEFLDLVALLFVERLERLVVVRHEISTDGFCPCWRTRAVDAGRIGPAPEQRLLWIVRTVCAQAQALRPFCHRTSPRPA